MRKCVVLTISNRKGGVGKTVSTVEIAKHADDRGYKVLICDMDPQGNAGSVLTGIDEFPTSHPTIYDVLVRPETPPENVILQASEDWPNTHIIPANVILSTTATALAGVVGYEKRLKKFLEPLKTYYDLIIIDTGPQITMNTNIAIYAADKVLIPTDYSKKSFRGVEETFNVIEMLKEDAGLKISQVMIVNAISHKDGAISNILSKNKFIERFGASYITNISIPHRIKVNDGEWRFDKPKSAKSQENEGDALFDSYAKLTNKVLDL